MQVSFTKSINYTWFFSVLKHALYEIVLWQPDNIRVLIQHSTKAIINSVDRWDVFSINNWPSEVRNSLD